MMKTQLHLAALILLLAIAKPALAMISIENVSPDRARELGIELRGTANGPNEAWIQMEFKPEGPLKDFQHVTLEIRDGSQFLLGWTALQAKRVEGSGKVSVGVMGNRKFLEKVTLRIVTGATGEEGRELKITDFVDLAKLKP